MESKYIIELSGKTLNFLSTSDVYKRVVTDYNSLFDVVNEVDKDFFQGGEPVLLLQLCRKEYKPLEDDVNNYYISVSNMTTYCKREPFIISKKLHENLFNVVFKEDKNHVVTLGRGYDLFKLFRELTIHDVIYIYQEQETLIQLNKFRAFPEFKDALNAFNPYIPLVSFVKKCDFEEETTVTEEYMNENLKPHLFHSSQLESVKVLFKKSKDINKKTQYVVYPFSSLVNGETKKEEVVETEQVKDVKGKSTVKAESVEMDEIDE